MSSHTHPGVRPGVTFASLGLPDALVQRLRRDGINEPFAIQAAAIPDALAGRDVLGRGQTGSGKTLAFGLPMLARLEGRTAKPRKPLAIVLVPTRELAMQVHDALMPLAHVVGVRTRLIAGGMPYAKQISGLERGAELVIATPGRLSDLVERGSCDLREVEVAVLDEADHMAEMGFLPAITELLDMIPVGGQRLLFSATLDRGVDGVVAKYLIDPVTHATESGAGVGHDDGPPRAARRAQPQGRRHRRDRHPRGPHRRLRPDQARRGPRCRAAAAAGVAAAALHGGLAQGARNAVLNAFKEGTLPVLVATDVAARGIHVDDIGLVLQVDPPQDHKDYLHRAGRTARAGGRGTVVTLALPHQRRAVERLTAAGRRRGAAPPRPGPATRPCSARPEPGAPRALPSPTRTSAGSPPPPASAAVGRAVPADRVVTVGLVAGRSPS